MESFFADEPQDVPGYQDSRELYPDDFIESLAQDFGFEHPSVGLLTKIYEVPYRYKLANRITAGGSGDITEQQKNLMKLQKTYESFIVELERQGEDYYNLEVLDGARISGELDPDLNPEDYPSQSFSINGCYWFEFRRYLTFFKLGLERTVQRAKSHGGRPKNEGLHLAVTYITSLWEFELGRKYTVDYHKGKGLTDAFEFTKRMLSPLDKIEEQQIITAMRSEIKSRREIYPEKATHRNLGQKPA